MALNSNFYAVVNELVSRASKGTASEIVDYASFIDVGKAIGSSFSTQELANAFASEIANKVRLSIDIVRSYVARGGSLVKERVPANSVIEIITNLFMDTRKAEFCELTDGQSVDMYVINKGKQKANYYLNDNAFQINCTIQADELEGAFQSPEKMQAFLMGKVTYMLNSGELAKEVARLGMMADTIRDCYAVTAEDDVDVPAVNYKLVTAFNTIFGLSGDDALDEDNALYNTEFIRFASAAIDQVRKNISNASNGYNLTSATAASASGKITTFTPEANKKLFIHQKLESAMKNYLATGVINGQSAALTNYETVPYWEAQDHPYTVKSAYYDETSEKYYTKPGGVAGGGQVVNNAAGEAETGKVIALLFDDMAMGEYPVIEDVATTPYNVRGRYTNDWLSVQSKYIRLKDANTVIFTLD